MQRGITPLGLSLVALSSGGVWDGTLAFTELQSGDVVTPTLTAPGVGCTNELPLTVQFVAQYTANCIRRLVYRTDGENLRSTETV